MDNTLTLRKANQILIALLACGLGTTLAIANERRFGYTYEPETMAKGAMEFEQWITLRTQRTSKGTVQQENFNQFEFREELEYGVTDRYTVGLYLNTKAESYRDVSINPPEDVSNFEFDGISLENRYMVLNPAENAIGVTLYLEPSFSGSEAEVEEKIIIGQRYGDWKWAVNLVHATEWEDNWHEAEGELQATVGVARDLSANWSLGLEFYNKNVWPEYDRFEYSSFYLGPVVSYRSEKWWATLSVLPQIYGKNYLGNPDDNTAKVLDEQEWVHLRLLIGFEF